MQSHERHEYPATGERAVPKVPEHTEDERTGFEPVGAASDVAGCDHYLLAARRVGIDQHDGETR